MIRENDAVSDLLHRNWKDDSYLAPSSWSRNLDRSADVLRDDIQPCDKR